MLSAWLTPLASQVPFEAERSIQMPEGRIFNISIGIEDVNGMSTPSDQQVISKNSMKSIIVTVNSFAVSTSILTRKRR